MTDTELARWLVERPWWTWRPGMRTQSDRVTERTAAIDLSALPDLSDPATGGVLLEVLRERAATSEGWVQTRHDEPGGLVRVRVHRLIGDTVETTVRTTPAEGLAPTLALACARALYALENDDG